MLGTPFTAGTLSSATSSATYSVPVSTPVPPGATAVVFAGASGATSATGVTDSQGNTYTAGPSSVANEYLQAFYCLSVTGLNPLAGDTWTVTYGAANTQQKNIIAVAVTGAAAKDVSTSANGSGTSMSVTGTPASATAAGNEVVLACYQDANAGGAPSGLSLTSLTTLSPGGQQYTTAAYGYLTRNASVTASGTITSAAWAVLLVSLTASPQVALGTGHQPAGGATLPPYPVLPNPRLWSSQDQLWAPRLRADPGNAISLLSQPPVVIAGQTTTGQSIPSSAVTMLNLDTELLDSWGSHQISNRSVFPQLAGWYLAEGYVFLNTTATATTTAAGIQAFQNAVAYQTDGGKVVSNGSNDPIPQVADLIQVSPATQDSIALYCWQDSGASKTIAAAYLKTEWVCAPSGNLITSPVPAAGWTSGATTLLAGMASGATSLIVADATGIVAGAILTLDYVAGPFEEVTVLSVSGQTVTLSSGTIYAHSAGAIVTSPISSAWLNQQWHDKISFLAYRPIARLTSFSSGQGNIASQTWPAGTAVTWSNPVTTGVNTVDNFTGWAAGNPTRYTFPVSGVYYLYGQAYLADAASSYILSAGLAISGGTIQWGDRVKTAGSAAESACATVRRTLRVTAGQYVEVFASQNSGGALAVKQAGNTQSKLVACWRGF